MSKTAAPTVPTFRKTKNGKWAIYGPASLVRPGTIRVRKANGTETTANITSLGKTFRVGTTECVYGYIAEEARSSRPARRNNRPARSRDCAECNGPCLGNCING